MAQRPDAGARTVPLSLLPSHPLGRQKITCTYRCGNACDHEPPNPTDNPYFRDVVAQVLSRRGVLRAGAVFSLAAGGLAVTGCVAAADGDEDRDRGGRADRGRRVPGLDFEPVQPNREDALVIPQGYQQRILIRWGDPVLPGAPDYDFDHQSAEAQAMQFGYNNDFCGLVPLRGDRWLMVNNHEYSSEPAMFRGYDPANPTEEQVRIGMAAHGMSVVVLERDRKGELTTRPDERYSRRITASSELVLAGPAAGSKFLTTSADPSGTTVLGTLNNCAGGVTPWGTILSGEENFNQYFANGDLVTDPAVKARYARYGVRGTASERKWERFEPRFDLAKEPNEAHRFGWVVELDPYEPDAPAVKHTALGRFKHEAATIQVARDGRVVAYMGDDERFDYVYKFVSDGKIKQGNSRRAREHNKSLLDSGTLYVARFTGDSPPVEIDGSGQLPSDGEFDGTGVWVPLVRGDTSFVPGMSAEEVYVFTREAGDKVGATKMDRPEDIEPNPHTGRVYLAMTNNTKRGTAGQAPVDEANPRPKNKNGHVVELQEDRNDAAAERFAWRLLLVCGDPSDESTYFAGFDKSQVSPISCPDNVAFDPHGNLWISTDGNALGFNDGLYGVALEGAERGQVKLFATVPIGAEACGPVIENRFVLISPQHPGDVDGASADNPASHWPDGGQRQPRPSVAAIYRDRRGRIGR